MTRTIVALVALLAMASPSRGAVTEETFKLKTGADLIELCAVADDDPLHTAAIHVCHGFGAGTYQTLQVLIARGKLRQFFCPPEPGPSRNEAVAAFVVWGRAHSDLVQYSPAEVVARYLIETYPCPKKTAKKTK
ncbi:MAG TPA: Rap1a/Tai family immunity protein [Candidatus Eisenbacteria bacterium]|nr:Rap1a/Tai family immunity protein [Candidatus Eisenbacteria bacterium]